MAVKLSIGKPKIDPQVEIGEPVIEQPTVPTQVSSMPRYAVTVGDPIIEQGMPSGDPSDNSDEVPFSDFFAAVKGNPAVAEKIVPGITSDKALAMMRPGTDGRPTLKLTPNQKDALRKHQGTEFNIQAVSRKMREATARNGMAAAGESDNVPTHVAPDAFAQNLGFKSWDAIPAAVLPMVLPGFDQANGLAPFLVRTATGDSLLLNPKSPAYEKTRLDILQKQQQIQAGPQVAMNAPSAVPPGMAEGINNE